jgi:hypothetical protein
MTMVSSSWKYLSIGLMAILAVGFSFPQAFGNITNNTQHMLQHIYNFVDGIEAKTDNLPSDPASNTVVNTRASQESVDNLQTTVNAISTDVQDVLSKVDSDQMLLRWQFSGPFSSSTRAVVLKEDAYSGVASFAIRTLPDADGDGDDLDCEVNDTGVKVDTDNNGLADRDVFIRDGAQFGGFGGGFLPAGTDQVFVSGQSVNGHGDCFFEINLLVEVKN